ncbi:MAG: DUF229 domain-containing protein, partial [Planctomycetota bacterium]
RPQLGCYGRRQMHSPHIDALASRGVLCERAYCMVPTCGASRAALMTSIRPAPGRFVSFQTWAEKDAPNAVPLHTHFRQAGYTTISLGKVLHHAADHASGWSRPPWRSSQPQYQDREAERRAIAEDQQRWPQKSKHRGPAFESADADEADYPDGQCATEAIRWLEKLSASPDQPFFLAVGFLKPHLPFCAPKKYWDLYDREEIHLPANYWPPHGAPAEALHNSGELRAYAGIHPSAPVDEPTARSLIHGYYACVSFVDAQIGRVVDALDRLGLAENTIIVLWGDHGWQLGEHGMWNKHSCFETSMHAPLIIVPPAGSGIDPGIRLPQLIEFIDIYPTLCELTDLSIPDHVQGQSLVPLMRNPNQPGKPQAIGRFGRGDTIRTDRFRYSEYRDRADRLTGRMLYDHEQDPQENENVADLHPDVAEGLAERLNELKGK